MSSAARSTLSSRPSVIPWSVLDTGTVGFTPALCQGEPSCFRTRLAVYPIW